MRTSLPLVALVCFVACGVGLQGENPTRSAASEEFRHALLMDATGDKANAAKIGKLKKTLEAQGFLVTHLPEARKNGYPAYERFVRSLPAKGKSILYYCGDVDIVKNAKTKRNEYHFRLGGYRFLPPDGFPGHNSRTVTDDQLRAMPTMSDRYVDGRVARVLPTASLRQLVILDLQSINDRANPDNSFERLLNGGRFLGFKPTAGEETTVCLANKENAGAALADKLNAALSSGKDILQGLTVGSRVMQQRMIEAIDANGLKPQISDRFPLEKLADAFRHEESGSHLGKNAIEI